MTSSHGTRTFPTKGGCRGCQSPQRHAVFVTWPTTTRSANDNREWSRAQLFWCTGNMEGAYIKLHELQKTLDAQGIEIVDNQKESVLGRKQLADRTKEFKKIPDDEKLNSFKGLLKAYQTEIDNLTKRSKVSENAFLNVYKDQAVEATEAYALEAEVAWLRTENAELRQSSSAHDASKRRVEQLEVRMDELVAQKESEINAAYDERMRNYEDREQDLQWQVSLYRDQPPSGFDILDDLYNFQNHIATYATTAIMKVAYGKTIPTSPTDPEMIEGNKLSMMVGDIIQPGGLPCGLDPLAQTL
ncbi:hypothetical protein DFH29DRAFT_879853 [Suillus ampliporus]|nr:hypothetical protein DFH29DRAFT_879853 [Suillus ampliporus]